MVQVCVCLGGWVGVRVGVDVGGGVRDVSGRVRVCVREV